MIGINKNKIVESIEVLADSQHVRVLKFSKEQVHLCMTVKDFDYNLKYDIDYCVLDNSLTLTHENSKLKIKLENEQIQHFMKVTNKFGQKMLEDLQ